MSKNIKPLGQRGIRRRRKKKVIEGEAHPRLVDERERYMRADITRAKSISIAGAIGHLYILRSSRALALSFIHKIKGAEAQLEFPTSKRGKSFTSYIYTIYKTCDD